MKVVWKNKKVIIGLCSVILLGGGLVVANAMNGTSKVNEAVESVAVLSTQVETTLQSEEIKLNEEEKNVEENSVESVLTVVQEQETTQQVQLTSQNSTTTNTTTQSSQVTKPVEQPKQNNNVAVVNTPKTNQANSNTNVNHNSNNNNNTNQNNGIKVTNESDGSMTISGYKSVTKENTTQAHPDSYYIEKYARDSQGRRVPVFKTMREAFEWGEKHADNETWYGLTGWEVLGVVTEKGIHLGWYSRMY